MHMKNAAKTSSSASLSEMVTSGWGGVGVQGQGRQALGSAVSDYRKGRGAKRVTSGHHHDSQSRLPFCLKR